MCFTWWMPTSLPLIRLKGGPRLGLGLAFWFAMVRELFFAQPNSRMPDWKWYLFVRILFRFPKFDSIWFLSAFTDIFHLIPGQKDKIHDSWKGRSYSNPWSSESCGRTVCFPCQGEKWITCWREGVTYTLCCRECGEKIAAYLGESGRNGCSRNKEHFEEKNSQKMRTILSSSPQKIYFEKSHYFKGFCCFSIAIAVNGGQGTHFLISQILKGLTHCALYWILLWPGLWAMNIQNKFADCGKEFSSPIWLNKHNQEYHKKTSPTVTSVKESST